LDLIEYIEQNSILIHVLQYWGQERVSNKSFVSWASKREFADLAPVFVAWCFLRFRWAHNESLSRKVGIFTSTKEIMFLPVFVCLFVSKITQKVMDGSF